MVELQLAVNMYADDTCYKAMHIGYVVASSAKSDATVVQTRDICQVQLLSCANSIAASYNCYTSKKLRTDLLFRLQSFLRSPKPHTRTLVPEYMRPQPSQEAVASQAVELRKMESIARIHTNLSH